MFLLNIARKQKQLLGVILRSAACREERHAMGLFLLLNRVLLKEVLFYSEKCKFYIRIYPLFTLNTSHVTYDLMATREAHGLIHHSYVIPSPLQLPFAVATQQTFF